jgi:hypothetical protein
MTPAGIPRIPMEGEDEPWQAAPARALVRYPLEHLAQWTVSFTEAEPDGFTEGGTWLRRRRIVVYVRSDWSPEKAANALAHEMGHVHDALYLNARSRDTFMRTRGLNWRERYVTVKWPAFTTSEPRKRQRVGCEDFAEVFAVRWAPPAEFQSSVRPAPSPDELNRLEPFLVPPPG